MGRTLYTARLCQQGIPKCRAGAGTSQERKAGCVCPWTTKPLGSLCGRLLSTPGGLVTPRPGRERRDGGVEGGTRRPPSWIPPDAVLRSTRGPEVERLPTTTGLHGRRQGLGPTVPPTPPPVASLQLDDRKRQQGSRPLFSGRLEGAAAPEASPSRLPAAAPGTREDSRRGRLFSRQEEAGPVPGEVSSGKRSRLPRYFRETLRTQAVLGPPSLLRLVTFFRTALSKLVIGSEAPSVTGFLWESRSLRETFVTRGAVGKRLVGPLISVCLLQWGP